jgi:hypothetical protein
VIQQTPCGAKECLPGRSASCYIRLPPKTNKQGVNTKVNSVANANPPAIEVANCVHHCVDGAPKLISRVTKSIFIANTIGINPKMVVIDTGRKRWAQVRNTA